jgi:hypothetical protein
MRITRIENYDKKLYFIQFGASMNTDQVVEWNAEIEKQSAEGT